MDTREALAQLLARSRRGVTARVNDNDLHQADDVLAEFLVVPRSDIQGIQYGWRNFDEHGGEWVWTCASREVAVADASSARRRDRARGRDPKAEALERPILPWSVIPLPEEPKQ
jgi:hypothetical protein